VRSIRSTGPIWFVGICIRAPRSQQTNILQRRSFRTRQSQIRPLFGLDGDIQPAQFFINPSTKACVQDSLVLTFSPAQKSVPCVAVNIPHFIGSCPRRRAVKGLHSSQHIETLCISRFESYPKRPCTVWFAGRFQTAMIPSFVLSSKIHYYMPPLHDILVVVISVVR